MHTYDSLLQKLLEVNISSGTKLGLLNMHKLDLACGNPSRSFPSIHVAGTNGKGSVSYKIAQALQLQGYKVGLYSSPHIASFRERMQINGEWISEEAITKILPFIFEVTEQEKIPATFFELTTMLAFYYFAGRQVDVAVLEVGLGGRLDATNIVTPLLSVITSISLDHTDILGKTIEAITLEKAGIIKSGVPVVIGPTVPRDLIRPIASDCIEVAGAFSHYDEENSAVARACLNNLQGFFNISEASIDEALKSRPSCRCEVIVKETVPVILDVGHNPAGLRCLFGAVERLFPEKKRYIIVGLSSSKDVSGCLEILWKEAEHLHLVEATNGRAIAASCMAEMLAQANVHPSTYCVSTTVASAMLAAIRQAKEACGIVVVCGSFFIMSDAREALGIAQERDLLEMNERK